MLDALTVGDFQPHVGADFRLTPAGGMPFGTTLAEVIEHHEPSAPRPPFTLVFRAPPGTMAPQGMYRVERDSGPPLDLFVVPTGPEPDGDGMLYEVVFG